MRRPPENLSDGRAARPCSPLRRAESCRAFYLLRRRTTLPRPAGPNPPNPPVPALFDVLSAPGHPRTRGNGRSNHSRLRDRQSGPVFRVLRPKPPASPGPAPAATDPPSSGRRGRVRPACARSVSAQLVRPPPPLGGPPGKMTEGSAPLGRGVVFYDPSDPRSHWNICYPTLYTLPMTISIPLFSILGFCLEGNPQGVLSRRRSGSVRPSPPGGGYL